jgi:hypothetical protein
VRGAASITKQPVIGAGEQVVKRDELLSSGHGKELSGRLAVRERQGCRHVLLTKE